MIEQRSSPKISTRSSILGNNQLGNGEDVEAATMNYHQQRLKHAEQIRRRLVDHLAAGGATDMAPNCMRLPASVYTDLERWQTERRQLFANTPLLACLSRDIPIPGSRLVFETAGRSILVVRDSSGNVRAFHNRCAHRGTRLVDNEASSHRASQRIVCPFHGWSYDLSGSLVNLPGREGFDAATLDICHLDAVAAEEWCGMVFIRAEGYAPLNLSEHLGSFAPLLESLEMSAMKPVQTSQLVYQTNWKYAIDTYAEGYHFGVLHHDSIGKSHFSNIAAFESYGPHWTLNFPEQELATLVNRPEDEWPAARHSGTFFIFPNVILVAGDLNPCERFLRLFRIFPGNTPGEMSCLFSVYAVGLSVEEFQARFSGVDDSRSEITHEDYSVAKGAWANLVTAEAFELTLGRNEIAVQAFHKSVFESTGLWP
jgi:nitrite reductase/ring-hydroxylating ferredoxin subunit